MCSVGTSSERFSTSATSEFDTFYFAACVIWIFPKLLKGVDDRLAKKRTAFRMFAESRSRSIQALDFC